MPFGQFERAPQQVAELPEEERERFDQLLERVRDARDRIGAQIRSLLAAALPADELDLDDDGDVAEPLPLDLDGEPRVVSGMVDMGAYETPALFLYYVPLFVQDRW